METLITTELNQILEVMDSIGVVGLLTILAVPFLRKNILGIDNTQKDEIKDEMTRIADRVTKHMDLEDERSKEFNERLSKMEQDVSYIRGKMEK